jgi:hypothetical protein
VETFANHNYEGFAIGYDAGFRAGFELAKKMLTL